MKTQRNTPEWLAERMCEILMSKDVLDPFNNTQTENLLEPSAGEGNLIQPLHRRIEFLGRRHITAIELNKEKYEKLKSKGYTAIHGDFLDLVFVDQKFRRILAAPPFINNIDLQHIQKMYSLLEYNGIMVTLTSPYWMTNNESHQVAFREWLKETKHRLEMVPDNTFIEKGKTVPTAILIITK